MSMRAPNAKIVALSFALCVLSILLSPQSAAAWVWWTIDGCPVAWDANPTIQIDVGPGDFYNMIQREAVSHPAARIGAVNDSWIDINLVTTTSTGSDNGESEIWMAPLPDGTLGLTMMDIGAYCEIWEMDIKIADDVDWIWGIPTTVRDPYPFGDGGDFYARPVIIHELLHGVGLDHTTSDFGYMHPTVSSGSVLFTNRDDNKRVEPAPKERQGLRTIYPQSETETDLAIANNIWPNDVGTGDIKNYKLCRPAYGLHWAGKFDQYCTTAEIHSNLCPGDFVKVRVPVMNYGHSSATYNLEMWFSINDPWGSGTDQESPTVRSATTGAVSTTLVETSFEIPSTVSNGQNYYIIMRVKPIANEESTMNNWMPMRGLIGIGTECP
ncbi:MAG: hypothetical protein IT350_06130 [Deltaproteobacteria bacterium]|nr:hypothetical protein [Deltaproteobacteria bacterium]